MKKSNYEGFVIFRRNGKIISYNPNKKKSTLKWKLSIQYFAKSTKHAIQRAKERGIAKEDILQTLKKPLAVVDGNPSNQGKTKKYIGSKVTVIVGKDGKIVTTWKTGKRGRAKLNKKR